MEERLVQLLKSEGINPTRFAERIGVQRSSMSHILSGRNKPSFDFIVKILESFPALNPDWLLRGKGLMYKTDVPAQPGLFDNLKPEMPGLIRKDLNVNSEASNNEETASIGMMKQESISTNDYAKKEIFESTKSIVKIVVFYSDKTFSDYMPEL